MRKLMLLLAVLIVPLLGTGCVIGNNYAFDYKPASMPNVGSGTTVVLAEPADLRPYIVNGEEPKSFVGEMRNGYGVPFNVLTEGERPLAEVIGEIVARDLTASGFNVVRGGAVQPDQIAAALRDKNAKRGLVITIKELDANTFSNIDVEWDLDACRRREDRAEVNRRRQRMVAVPISVAQHSFGVLAEDRIFFHSHTTSHVARAQKPILTATSPTMTAARKR